MLPEEGKAGLEGLVVTEKLLYMALKHKLPK
jgi:hypothetical protein